MAVREIKVCLLGDTGVGKSSIATRFVQDSFRPSMEATIGASFLTKTITVEGRIFKFQIWDTAGQEKYRALAPMYYRGAAAAIVVFDLTSHASFVALKSWIKELQKHGPHRLVLAIAGNKCDLEDLREVQVQEAEEYAQSVGAIMVETSAKTAMNVSALFHEISKRLPAEDFSRLNEGKSKNSPVRLGKQEQDNNAGRNRNCC